MNEWQPIETAPKDGRQILIATRSYIYGVTMAAWMEDVPEPAFMDDSGDSYFDATHWMPLPAPPARSTQQGS